MIVSSSAVVFSSDPSNAILHALSQSLQTEAHINVSGSALHPDVRSDHRAFNYSPTNYAWPFVLSTGLVRGDLTGYVPKLKHLMVECFKSFTMLYVPNVNETVISNVSDRVTKTIDQSIRSLGVSDGFFATYASDKDVAISMLFKLFDYELCVTFSTGRIDDKVMERYYDGLRYGRLGTAAVRR